MAIICIDFDGTVVTHEFPKVGRDIGAVPVLKRLVNAGHQLILFTMRSKLEGISPITNKMESGGLTDAIQWFIDNGIQLWAVNENPNQKTWTSSPKPYSQLYIDDAALGCPLAIDDPNMPGRCERPYANWEEIEELLELLEYLPAKPDTYTQMFTQ
jgi:hypothetical protein